MRLFPGTEGEAVWARTERLLLEQPQVKEVVREGGVMLGVRVFPEDLARQRGPPSPCRTRTWRP